MSIGPSDLGYNLLPPDPGLISPDFALEAALAPVVTYGTPDEVPLGKGWAFDFIANEFVLNGNAPAEVYGLDNLRMWIEKTMRTARYAHPIYTESYGVEEPFALIGQPPSGDLIATWQDAVVEALTAHDRIAAVNAFYYSQDPFSDALYVSFTVVLDADAEQTIQVDQMQVGG
jgi:hypothetical protein